ncbi:MAG: Rpn family recombination-promoting nuclease/putative transposase [Lachnospiraceae bacterium]|nr:Rpn family recombination-promoting nuclease/putative transposase [Lachnospiraceae bacterium]
MKHENQVHKLSTLPSGKIRYTLTNDYMFRAVFQKNQNALKGLLSVLLGIPKKQIKELRILNPIILGETIDDKTCILDLHLRLNNNELINIEMQVSDFGNWSERSITYLGRAFDQTQSGGDYSNISTTMHIGILDFNLTHLTPEFYSEFRLMNVKNHEIYSDKFILRVLNLKTLEDNSIEKEPADLYYWAKLFKATTWEELKMLASKNPDFEDTIVTMQELSVDEKVKLQCMARERYEWDLASATAKGKREGRAEGEQRSFLLIQKLSEEGLTDLISKAASDPVLRQELYKKYNL